MGAGRGMGMGMGKSGRVGCISPNGDDAGHGGFGSAALSACLPVCLSACLFACLFVCPLACLSVCLSIYIGTNNRLYQPHAHVYQLSVLEP